MGIAYRPEIDGLRAIAVLAVVLFHAGVGGAGFVGVDVFFVISGYLITSLLLKERDASGINLLAFYARRVRRIFPAAAVVVLAVLAISFPLFAPAQQAHTANSAGAALVFGANVFFQLTSGGYFDGRAEEMPLLHLWSLSVEEQFYFLWPALLMLVPRRGLRPTMIGLAVASLALAEYWIWQGSDAAFYEMPSRFWELAAGGLIAAAPQRSMPRWMLPAGIALTLASCTYPAEHFPGIGALPAVLGACAIIGAVHGGGKNALLSSRPMVAVGLISYSLYLWHWPLLAFYRATSIGEGETRVRLMLCAVAVLLAVASYRYIEQPFRRMKFRSGRTVAVGASLSAVLALSACGLGWNTKQAEFARADNPLAARTEADYPDRRCHATGMDPAAIKCKANGRVLVWGDSMAYAWMPAFPHAAQATRDACPPLIGALPPDPKPGDYKCRDFNAKVASSVSADTVVLVAWWANTWHGDLNVTLDALKGRHVIILGPTPTMRDDLPKCIRRNLDCGISRAEFDAQAQPILAALRQAAKGRPDVEVIDLASHFCDDSRCPMSRDGAALYWDSHHVSATAARKFSER
jgi:peptidoglycan/LPS O-acetylase OafA/YrhL